MSSRGIQYFSNFGKDLSRHLTKTVMKYLSLGNFVYINGILRTGSWEDTNRWKSNVCYFFEVEEAFDKCRRHKICKSLHARAVPLVSAEIPNSLFSNSFLPSSINDGLLQRWKGGHIKLRYMLITNKCSFSNRNWQFLIHRYWHQMINIK